MGRILNRQLDLALAGLGTGGPDDTLRAVLRQALRDPTLDIVYAKVGSGGWITGLGEHVDQPIAGDGRTFTAIDRGGKSVAGLLHDRRLLRRPRRLQAAVDAASLALDNERLKAQLRAEVLEARASRSRILDAGDRELQRLERNLHDGAQQRLVGLALTLRLASRRAAGDDELTSLLAEAGRDLNDALAELRELSRGLHPTIVDDAGLRAALESLAERPGAPVELQIDLPERLPETVEVATYYLVAEALTNANKHAGAAGVTVQAYVQDGALRVHVIDDGAGGAVAAPGSGLQGLADRIGALGGEFRIESPATSGTTVTAEIPLDQGLLTDAEGRRMTALRWWVQELWEMPAEAADQMTDEDNLMHGKAVLLVAGGNGRVTEREREWLIGYLTAARDADWVLDAIATYDDSETLHEFMRVPGFPEVSRGALYDAIRMCTSDGPLTVEERMHLERGADEIGAPHEILDEVCAIVAAEGELRHRRFNAIAAPALPHGSQSL
jgi:signal transduction histidine kinase